MYPLYLLLSQLLWAPADRGVRAINLSLPAFLQTDSAWGPDGFLQQPEWSRSWGTQEMAKTLPISDSPFNLVLKYLVSSEGTSGGLERGLISEPPPPQ